MRNERGKNSFEVSDEKDSSRNCAVEIVEAMSRSDIDNVSTILTIRADLRGRSK